jgi:hypothetical protein
LFGKDGIGRCHGRGKLLAINVGDDFHAVLLQLGDAIFLCGSRVLARSLPGERRRLDEELFVLSLKIV